MTGPTVAIEAERDALGQWKIRTLVNGQLSAWKPVRGTEDVAALIALRTYDEMGLSFADDGRGEGHYRLARATWPLAEVLEGKP